MVHLEPGLEVALEQPRPVVGQRPRARGAPRDRLQRLVQVQPGAIPVDERLAHADHPGGDRELVDHLGVLAGPGRALELDRLAQGVEHGSRARERVPVAAHHDHERSVAGAHVSARHRGVERADVLGLGGFVDLDRERGLAGGHVDQQRPLPHRLEHLTLPEDHVTHVGRGAEHRDHHVGVLGDLRRGVAPLSSGFQQRLGAAARAVVDGDVVAAVQEVARHRPAHHAGADPADPEGRCHRRHRR